ncbi:palmitoyl-acyl carrier protein thioesterase, chloroplastic-like [Jatropha curcas]|uniref:Acyl-[acyl-carrier-protein] hydrolase n=1 Tax=Jatropha curcas TaxID=180498 RepID=L0L581_JATCU|nr:palmitoyl-acyl carrier protein thioesterase, chloroplastic-like [Jatropha curcas]AGB56143.1 acyl-ACP thioesterase [Jatropha curcas]
MASTAISFLSIPIKLIKEEMRMASAGRRKNTIAAEFGHFTFGSATVEKKVQKSNNFLIDGGFGSLEQNGLIYRQNIFVRSFEIGFDRKLSLAALTNFLQDTALNHCRMIGLLAEGFGSTPEMIKKDLIWVLCTLQILVDGYPSWLDVVEVDTWMYPSGQNGLGRGWLVRDGKTGRSLAQSSSVMVSFNKKTRKLSKLAKEIRDEIAPHMMDCDPIMNKNSRKILPFDVNTADYARTGLTPGWNELDLNQHVNHVQYINWILQNVRPSLVQHHKLSAITLEYRKECDMNSILQSLSRIVKNGGNDSTDKNNVIELDHFLLLENGSEIARANTIWKPREVNNFKNVVHSPAEENISSMN